MSRDQQLHLCERKFYFQYLAVARVSGGTDEQRRIAILKKVKTIQMWQGECFHWAIARYLNMIREDQIIFADQLLNSLREKMEREWRFSEQRRYRDQPMLIGREGVALFEHEYSVNSHDTLDTAYEFVRQLVERFIVWVSSYSELSRKISRADGLWIEPPAFGVDAPGVTLDGVQVITKVDLALQISGESFEIYDWKTGKAPPYRTTRISHNDFQVMVYQLWPHMKLRVPLGLISANLVYFGGTSAEQQKFCIDEEALASTTRLVRNSIALAQRWQKNFATGAMQLSDLDYAAAANICRQCSFKALCHESVSLIPL
jgi:hypothetical protein